MVKYSAKKQKSPDKENSPLKRMGSLRKQSRLAAQENLQTYERDSKNSISPSKPKGANLLRKAATLEEKVIKGFEASNIRSSPLKQKMRLFEETESPQKQVKDL